MGIGSFLVGLGGVFVGSIMAARALEGASLTTTCPDCNCPTHPACPQCPACNCPPPVVSGGGQGSGNMQLFVNGNPNASTIRLGDNFGVSWNFLNPSMGDTVHIWTIMDNQVLYNLDVGALFNGNTNPTPLMIFSPLISIPFPLTLMIVLLDSNDAIKAVDWKTIQAVN